MRRQILWIIGLFIGLYIGTIGFRGFHGRSGDLLILLSAVFFGLGNVYSRSVMSRHGSQVVPDLRLAIGSIFALILGIFTVHSYKNLLAVVPYGLLAGLFYWLVMKTFAIAVHKLNANMAIVLNQSQIFFTSLGGTLILSERYSFEKFIASILVITSIYFITKR